MDFIYSPCGPFTKNTERIQKCEETRYSIYIFIKANSIKLAFNMTWVMEILKIYLKKTIADKILSYKAFSIRKNLKYDGYQRRLASLVYNFFNKKLRVEPLKFHQTKN